jgi:hypothetical protein
MSKYTVQDEPLLSAQRYAIYLRLLDLENDVTLIHNQFYGMNILAEPQTSSIKKAIMLLREKLYPSVIVGGSDEDDDT